MVATAPTVRVLRREHRQTQCFREPLAPEHEPELQLTLVQIPKGNFLIGSPNGELERAEDEGPQQMITLSEFWMAQTPITQAQWRAVAQWQPREGEHWGRDLHPNPSRFGDHADSDQRPVESVSWWDAMEFCHRLSQRTGRTYRLPSEAQWEYACRAGSTTPFAFGETLSAELANYNASRSYANGPKGKYRQQTTPVARFPANTWGLHDLHGNVLEWCLDEWHGSYKDIPKNGQPWADAALGHFLDKSAQEITPENQRRFHKDADTLEKKASPVIEDEYYQVKSKDRLLRGGSWFFGLGFCRSAFRSRLGPGYVGYDVGLRVVCIPQDL